MHYRLIENHFSYQKNTKTSTLEACSCCYWKMFHKLLSRIVTQGKNLCTQLEFETKPLFRSPNRCLDQKLKENSEWTRYLLELFPCFHTHASINKIIMDLRSTVVHGFPHLGQLHWFPDPFLSLPPLLEDETLLQPLSWPWHETPSDV